MSSEMAYDEIKKPHLVPRRRGSGVGSLVVTALVTIGVIISSRPRPVATPVGVVIPVRSTGIRLLLAMVLTA
jgi:hypothetical protein